MRRLRADEIPGMTDEEFERHWEYFMSQRRGVKGKEYVPVWVFLTSAILNVCLIVAYVIVVADMVPR